MKSHLPRTKLLGCLAAVLLGLPTRSAAGTQIPLEKLAGPPAAGFAVHEVMAGEVPGVITEQVTIVGPARFSQPATSDENIVWFLLRGRGTVLMQDQTFPFAEETIARAPLGAPCEIAAAPGETVVAVRIRKKLTAEDRADLPRLTLFQTTPYVQPFRSCPAYGEAIKSARTVSRTLLPQDIVPRMAAGTVETTGPDRVLRHQHPMLEQYFIGLAGNDAAVTADDQRVDFPELSVLHIPLGSMHGAEVAAGKKLYYIWLDFFLTKEGQVWLKTHRPVTEAKAP
ncbi:MAG: hypothetical protein HY302_08855 [Opitutae bacterium]|nr:hypothetical protein [Opitutae bacterium]